MINYQCDQCGMGVKGLCCAACSCPLEHGAIDVDGQSVHVSKCPKGCGMIKSPQCCGQDMSARPNEEDNS